MRALALLALVACTYPTKELSGWECLGQPVPTPSASIHISGQVFDYAKNMGVPATVSMFHAGDTNPGDDLFGSGGIATASDGTFSSTVSTAFEAITAEFVVQPTDMANYGETFVFTGRPIAGDTSLVIEALPSSNLIDFMTDYGVTIDPSLAQVILTVEDCDQAGVPTAKVSDRNADQVFYVSNFEPSAGATATDSSGAAIILNVPPPGAAKLHFTAKVFDLTLGNDASVPPMALSQVIIQPQPP
ncbi:MAG TPA: hypothetical protein VLX92_07475 [Kofleriaceae bacterium]|nr:hypothetical protein [Kofleriaceae bacterium]